MKSLLVKHPTNADEFCVTSTTGVTWYRAEAAEPTHLAHGQHQNPYQAIRLAHLGDGVLPSWLRSSADGGVSTGKGCSVLTAAFSPVSRDGRMCLLGLDNGSIVSAVWNTPGGAAEEPLAVPLAAGAAALLTTGQQRSMDVLVSLGEHQKPLCSTFLSTANTFLYSVGTDQGNVLLYDVNAAFHSSRSLGGARSPSNPTNRQRIFGSAEDDSVVPLTCAHLRGRVCALEPVTSTPLVVASSCIGYAPSPTVSTTDFSSSLVQFHSSVGGGGLFHCSPFGESAPSKLGGGSSSGSFFGGAPPGGAVHASGLGGAAGGGSWGSRANPPNARYTLQLLDLRVASSQFNYSREASTGVVFGGGGDNNGGSGLTNIGISRAGVFAEHVAVHPSLPLVATCGTMHHGSSRRNRGRPWSSRRQTEVVQLWDARQPSAPAKVICATCPVHTALRWKPLPVSSSEGSEPRLVGVTTTDVRYWTFNDLPGEQGGRGNAVPMNSGECESGTEAGTEDGCTSTTWIDGAAAPRYGSACYSSDTAPNHQAERTRGAGGAQVRLHTINSGRFSQTSGTHYDSSSTAAVLTSDAAAAGAAATISTGSPQGGGGKTNSGSASSTRTHQLRKTFHSVSSQGGGAAMHDGPPSTLHQNIYKGGARGSIKGGSTAVLSLRPLSNLIVAGTLKDNERRELWAPSQPFAADWICCRAFRCSQKPAIEEEIDEEDDRGEESAEPHLLSKPNPKRKVKSHFFMYGLGDEPFLVVVPQPRLAGICPTVGSPSPPSSPPVVVMSPFDGALHASTMVGGGHPRRFLSDATTKERHGGAAVVVALGRTVLLLEAVKQKQKEMLAPPSPPPPATPSSDDGHQIQQLHTSPRPLTSRLSIESQAFALSVVVPSVGKYWSTPDDNSTHPTSSLSSTMMHEQWCRVKCATRTLVGVADDAPQTWWFSDELAGRRSRQQHGNAFTADRSVAMRTLLARREVDAFIAFRYTALIRHCQNGRTLPVTRYPPGLLDLVRGAVGGSARSSDASPALSSAAPCAAASCEWHVTEDPLRALILQTMGWLPSAVDDTLLLGEGAPHHLLAAPPLLDDKKLGHGRAPALGDPPSSLSCLDLASLTTSIHEAVERRVGILLLCGRSDIATAMLLRYASLDKTFPAIAALLHALCDVTGSSHQNRPPPLPSLQWLQTDLLRQCGGHWLRAMLSLYVWVRLMEHSRSVLINLSEMVKGWTKRVNVVGVDRHNEDERLWLEFCSSHEEKASSARTSAMESTHRLGYQPQQRHSQREPQAVCDASSLGWSAEMWRALHASPPAKQLSPLQRVDAMQRLVERQCEFALGAILLDGASADIVRDVMGATTAGPQDPKAAPHDTRAAPHDGAPVEPMGAPNARHVEDAIQALVEHITIISSQQVAATAEEPQLTPSQCFYGQQSGTGATANAATLLSACGSSNAKLLRGCVGLPASDRAALAAILLPNNSNAVLSAVLRHISTSSSFLSSSPLAVVFAGFGDAGARLMQNYVDVSGDVQLAACIFAPYCRPRSVSSSSSAGSGHASTAAWSVWNRTYSAQLNAQGACYERARHDRDVRVQQLAQSTAEQEQRQQQASPHSSAGPTPTSVASSGRGAAPRRAIPLGGSSAAPSVEVRCSCGQSLHDSAFVAKSASAVACSGFMGGAQRPCITAQPTAVTRTLGASCPSERCAVAAHQVICAVCVQSIGPSGSGLRGGPGSWLTWCTACLHGGHVKHIHEWFEKHRKCPVNECPCMCSAV